MKTTKQIFWLFQLHMTAPIAVVPPWLLCMVNGPMWRVVVLSICCGMLAILNVKNCMSQLKSLSKETN